MTIEQLKERLIKASPENYREIITDAIAFAQQCHDGQLRYSGDPYLVHALDTAIMLAEMELDSCTIIAGLLHNTISNSPWKKEELKKLILQKFGQETYDLIEKCSRINKATASTDTDYEIVCKSILNANTDIRPILIKLADTLDNVRTIQYMPQERISSKVQKIFNIYGPMAEYLNLDEIKKELEEKALEIYRVDEYKAIGDELQKKDISENLKNTYCEYFNTLFREYNPDVQGRVKSKYSIYKKLKKQLKEGTSIDISSIRDLIAFRILVDNQTQCFNILERVMDNGDLLLEEFDDYISNPKKNGYKAIQGPAIFPLISPNVIEIQILTKDMHYTNTYGTASHIAYKESQSRYANPTDKYKWVEQVHKEIMENKTNRNNQFSIPINAQIFENNRYAFTPKGKIIQLDSGDTVVDFAYRVHTAIGNSMVGAKVNGLPTRLEYEIQTGDTVEIKTQPGKKSSKIEWVAYAHSPSTKTKIEKSWKNV